MTRPSSFSLRLDQHVDGVADLHLDLSASAGELVHGISPRTCSRCRRRRNLVELDDGARDDVTVLSESLWAREASKSAAKLPAAAVPPAPCAPVVAVEVMSCFGRTQGKRPAESSMLSTPAVAPGWPLESWAEFRRSAGGEGVARPRPASNGASRASRLPARFASVEAYLGDPVAIGLDPSCSMACFTRSRRRAREKRTAKRQVPVITRTVPRGISVSPARFLAW
jgi:hypothetical protein